MDVEMIGPTEINLYFSSLLAGQERYVSAAEETFKIGIV